MTDELFGGQLLSGSPDITAVAEELQRLERALPRRINMNELVEIFGLEREDLNLNLGPLGDLP